MSKTSIIRAWKDREYRESLREAERALLPGNPAGLIELTEAELKAAAGGTGYCTSASVGHCHFTECIQCDTF
jgi:mersacidin/lichenicidin family type 2 lantibiotic